MKNEQNIISLVKKEQAKTIQNNLNSHGNFSDDINKDYKLALYFYNFLQGKSDKLPTDEFISKVISMNKGKYGLISLACGLTVNVTLNDYLEQIILENVEPINQGITRIDKIASDLYEAYILNSFNKIEEIDVNEFPLFDKNRINYLQKYLKQYKFDNIDSKAK